MILMVRKASIQPRIANSQEKIGQGVLCVGKKWIPIHQSSELLPSPAYRDSYDAERGRLALADHNAALVGQNTVITGQLAIAALKWSRFKCAPLFLIDCRKLVHPRTQKGNA